LRNLAIVLLSGGLDSLVSLACAIEKGIRPMAITFDYGQRARKREIEAGRRICRYYKVRHKVIKLDWLKEISSTPIVKNKGKIPGPEVSRKKGRDIAWVPNRNGVMVNIAASIAEAMGYRYVVIGTNAEEGKFFPDNTQGFINTANKVLSYSTRGKVRVISFTGKLKKRDIVRRGLELNAPLQYLWSCYRGGRDMCLKCHSCRYIVDSFKALGMWDEFRQRRKGYAWS
jgi:7-cyano-7-deazaguanine synthase